MQRSKACYIFSGSTPPSPTLPKGYASYDMEQMAEMLESALKIAGCNYIDENRKFVDEVEGVHKQMLESIHGGHYEHADICLGYMLQNNQLVVMAQKLVDLQAQKMRDKYGVFPNSAYFEGATKLLAKCEAVWRQQEFSDALEALQDNGHTQGAEELSSLFENFKTPGFVVFLMQRMTRLVPQAEQENANQVSASFPVFFKPEMLLTQDNGIPLFDPEKKPAVDIPAPLYEKDYEEFERPFPGCSSGK
jgi:hypothetical protein